MKSAAAELSKHADKDGGIDKADYHTAAKHLKAGNHKDLRKHLKKVDTSPREKILTTMDKHGINTKKYHWYGHEEVEQIDEARGRPKKAGQMDYTVHPKTKEKLMHSNPTHMKRIEALYRTGALKRPKTEAGQNVITQLRKASTSMRGGETVNFTHGSAKRISAAHAQKALEKHAGMRPAEKEAFQKKISHSHDHFMKHIK